ncbi:M23 family metallopeptidase [Nocardia higoensis]|uniref:M23 family metallopeptidase n=1 Tax=Nocardia higoensis TaxID=228599 RepID=A0ABS0DC86_9NOCA|nr:M23 family metallopeptidase [Nocardia higoensis]MBF6356080.1 M23 family metallopeptidase [Nocardia higoensis]
MSQHRVGPSSITVESLLGSGVEGRGGTAVATRPTRHRAAPAQSERIRAAAGAAVAGAALVGVAAQVAPALAAASPLAPERHTDAAEEAITFQGTGEIPLVEAAQAIAAPAEAAEPPVTAVAAPVAQPVSQPFGLQNLPAEIATPLGQVEDILKGVQQHLAPPVAVRPVAGVISSGYGARWGSMHYGIDFADALGAPIKSVSNGTVIEAGPASGFGLWVRVLQDDGTTAVYGHVNDMYVQAGQRVNAGDVIATVGNRGQSTGPHLHLEIWDQGGNKIDPQPYLAAKGVPMQWGPSHAH